MVVIKNIYFSLFIMFVCSCQSNDTSLQNNVNDSTTSLYNQVEASDYPLKSLEDFNGKYPMEINFLDHSLIHNRIQNMLADDYAYFRKYWTVETPITIYDHILYATGCEQHNCAANQFVLIIDLKNDNINIIHINDESKSYFENGVIGLPIQLKEELNTLLNNALF